MVLTRMRLRPVSTDTCLQLRELCAVPWTLQRRVVRSARTVSFCVCFRVWLTVLSSSSRRVQQNITHTVHTHRRSREARDYTVRSGRAAAHGVRDELGGTVSKSFRPHSTLVPGPGAARSVWRMLHSRSHGTVRAGDGWLATRGLRRATLSPARRETGKQYATGGYTFASFDKGLNSFTCSFSAPQDLPK